MDQFPEVLCLGETMVMVTPADGGRLNTASPCLLRAGGAESNVARHLAALGHRSAWAGALGDDPLGDIVVRELERSGVLTDAVLRDPGHRTGTYFKDPSPTGTTVYYYRDRSAASAMSLRTGACWSESMQPQLLHVSGITAALSDSCRELLHQLVLNRTFEGASVSFDVNFRPSLWKRGSAAAELLELASASDIVFVGRDEAEALWGTGDAQAIRKLLPEVPHLIVKDGAENAWEFSGEEITACAPPRVDVLEPVGAGDAFAAGWISGHLRRWDTLRRLRLGHLLASRVLTSPSDDAPPPTPDELRYATSLDPQGWELAAPEVR